MYTQTLIIHPTRMHACYNKIMLTLKQDLHTSVFLSSIAEPTYSNNHEESELHYIIMRTEPTTINFARRCGTSVVYISGRDMLGAVGRSLPPPPPPPPGPPLLVSQSIELASIYKLLLSSYQNTIFGTNYILYAPPPPPPHFRHIVSAS